MNIKIRIVQREIVVARSVQRVGGVEKMLDYFHLVLS